MHTIESTNGTHTGLNLKTATVDQLRDEVERLDTEHARAVKKDRKAGDALLDANTAKRDTAAARTQARAALDQAEAALQERQAK